MEINGLRLNYQEKYKLIIFSPIFKPNK